jgi:hypothetical protein
VKQAGGQSYKWISTVTGVPDRIVLLNKKVHFVELKTAKGVLSPRQQVVFRDLAEEGFITNVIRSKSDVETFIDGC